MFRRILLAAAVIAGITTLANAQAPIVGPVQSTNGTLVSPTITGGTISGTDASGANITATGGSASRPISDQKGDVLNVKDFGAKGDGKFATPSVTTTASSATLTVGSATFASTDVGKWVIVANAASPTTNTWGANVGPVTSIPVTSPGSGYTSVPACAETDSSGSGNNATCAAWMGLQSATVATGGTCQNGTWTFFATQKSNQSPARLTGTVAGGALTSLAVTSPGQYASLVNAVALTSGQCSVQPTATFSWGVSFIQTLDWGNNAGPTPNNSYAPATTTASLTGGSPTTPATLGTPVVSVVIPPWVEQITGYTSPTQVTLSTPAGVTLTGIPTKIFWGTDDSTAIQATYTATAASGKNNVYIPTGTYYVKSRIDPGVKSTSTHGDGMNSTMLMWDAGPVSGYATAGWTPLYYNINNGSPSAPNGDFQIENLQIRGTLDFGRRNQGAPAFAMNFYNSWMSTRVKYLQIPFMVTQNEGMKHYIVDNSIFDTVERDAARCRSCFDFRVTNSSFIHSDDDSIAAHQGSQMGVYGLLVGGALRDSILVENNYFEDTTCIHILGGRNVIVRGNVLKRCKINTVTISTDAAGEGNNAMFNIIVADNIATDTINRPPYASGNPTVFAVTLAPAASVAGDATIVPSEPIFGTTYFPPPWNSYLGSTVAPVNGVPMAAGISIHDNVTLRTMPSTTAFSSWGFGPGFSYVGFIDAPVTDAALISGSGIYVTPYSNSIQIHHNQINNSVHGITLAGVQTYSGLATTQIDQNSIYDTYGGGIYDITSGYRISKITNNIIATDPYHISPGRSGNNGSWANGYNNSYCIYIGNYGTNIVEDNVMRECYAATVTPSLAWARDNYVLGTPYSSATTFITDNVNGGSSGVGAYPQLGSGFRYIPTTESGSGGNGASPATFNQNASSHPYESLTMPTGNWGYKYGEFVRSLDPAACTCFGWMRLNSTSANNVAGTDWKVVPLQ